MPYDSAPLRSAFSSGQAPIATTSHPSRELIEQNRRVYSHLSATTAGAPAGASAADNAQSMRQTNPGPHPELRRSGSMDFSHLIKKRAHVGVLCQARASIIRGGQELPALTFTTGLYERYTNDDRETKLRVWGQEGKGAAFEEYPESEYRANWRESTGVDQWGMKQLYKNHPHGVENSQTRNNFESELTISKYDAELIVLKDLDVFLSEKDFSEQLQAGDLIRIEMHGNDGPCNGCKFRQSEFLKELTEKMNTLSVSVQFDVFYTMHPMTKARGQSNINTCYGWIGEPSSTAAFPPPNRDGHVEILKPALYSDGEARVRLYGARYHLNTPLVPDTEPENGQRAGTSREPAEAARPTPNIDDQSHLPPHLRGQNTQAQAMRDRQPNQTMRDQSHLPPHLRDQHTPVQERNPNTAQGRTRSPAQLEGHISKHPRHDGHRP